MNNLDKWNERLKSPFSNMEFEDIRLLGEIDSFVKEGKYPN